MPLTHFMRRTLFPSLPVQSCPKITNQDAWRAESRNRHWTPQCLFLLWPVSGGRSQRQPSPPMCGLLALKRVENKSKPTSGSRLTLAYQTRGGGGPPRGGPQIRYSHTRPPSRSLSSCPSSKCGIGIASGKGARLRSGNNSHTLGQCERCPHSIPFCKGCPHHTHVTHSASTEGGIV